MLHIRRSEDRGRGEHGWLHSRHSFSFADYHDPRFMGYRDLRVINEDREEPGHGFGTHGHRDMEIISYVLDGALEHADSTGTRAVIRPGEVQRMTAGTGVRHSEYNHSKQEPVHFLQIWILPREQGLPPGYEQKAFDDADEHDALRLVASPDGREGSVTVHQDVDLYVSRLEPGAAVSFERRQDRHLWLHVARGEVRVNGKALAAGDAVATNDEEALRIEGAGTDDAAEILLFDLS
jgi:redox-sensitive bicupin YhaK (pirin superfamily)